MNFTCRFHKVPAAFAANSLQAPGGRWCFQSVAAIVSPCV